MNVRFVMTTGVEEHDDDALEKLLERDDGFVWLDADEPDAATLALLGDVFGFHPMALEACRERNRVPTLHSYRDHLFLVLNAPHAGAAGHVHLLEMDFFLSTRYLVTVHGPLNPAVPKSEALAETSLILQRLESGRLRPAGPVDLAYSITTAAIRRQRAMLDRIAATIPVLQAKVMESNLRNPESLLDEMFLLRQELLTVRTMAAQQHEVLARAGGLADYLPAGGRARLVDLAEQCARIARIAEGERDFLLGVIDLFQTRTSTKMTVAMERLAVLAAVTLPITAIASVYGMNVIVNGRTHVVQLLLVLAAMATISAILLRWTRKQGWW